MRNRLLKIRTLLKKQKLDAILISSVSNIIYLTGYSGFSRDEREAFLLITKENQYIITDGRYSEAVYNHIPHFQLIEISSKKTLENIFRDLAKKESIKKLGFEPENITVSEYKLFKNIFTQTSPISLTSLRILKEPSEVDSIEQACRLGDKAFEHILTKIKKGVTEKEVAFELELFIKKQGADISFPPIVAFGKNSSIPHHLSTNTKLKINDIVLFDFGVKLNNYCSDMTRTVFFGKATKEQKRMYQAVLEAQKRTIDFLKSSIINHKSIKRTVKARDVDRVARSHITSSDFSTIPHSLGHGVGIEVHESPRLSPNSNDELKPGMVFSIEPGIYIPGFGGVRIEDLLVLEKNKVRILTHAPKELVEL